MPEVTGMPAKVPPGPVLAELFTIAARLAKTQGASATGLLSAVAGYLAAGVWGHGPKVNLSSETGGLLAFLVGVATYTLLAPSSRVTTCLMSVQDQFVKDLITSKQRDQLRKKCLRKSLLY